MFHTKVGRNSLGKNIVRRPHFTAVGQIGPDHQIFSKYQNFNRCVACGLESGAVRARAVLGGVFWRQNFNQTRRKRRRRRRGGARCRSCLQIGLTCISQTGVFNESGNHLSLVLIDHPDVEFPSTLLCLQKKYEDSTNLADFDRTSQGTCQRGAQGHYEVTARR